MSGVEWFFAYCLPVLLFIGTVMHLISNDQE